uniref:Uncharacterized protein n=1 Tax=viral metagenome TaxID=1070528 RepID=A0A6C0CGN7_9ZZZZ
MSILIAYERENRIKRIHISAYDSSIHKGKLVCADGHDVVGKKGAKVVWHYAHAGGLDVDCGSCSRVMGEWHRWWQNRVEPDFLEIIIKRDGINHIADMINAEDIVIEFQKSVVPGETILEREKFYDRMIWIFCCTDVQIKVIATHGRYVKLKMCGGSKYFLAATKPTFLDFGKRGVLELLKIKNARKAKPELYARIWTMREFDEAFMRGCLLPTASSRVDREPYQFEEKTEDFSICEKILDARKK